MHDSHSKTAQTRVGRQRLARISHHFLSEPQAIEPQLTSGSSASLVLLIDDSQTPSFPVLQLAAQLAGHGLECEIEQPGQAMFSIRPQSPAPAGNDTSTIAKQEPYMTVRIRAGHTADNIPPASSYTLLLPTEASPQGVRQSYFLLKHHMQRSCSPHTGITMTGTDDPALARHYFSALHVACQRFMNCDPDWRLYSYGLLHHHHHPNPELAGIARLLVDDCINMMYGHPGSRQDKKDSDNSQPARSSHDN